MSHQEPQEPETRPEDGEPDALTAEISRGQRLDRDLARALGHPAPARTEASGAYVESVERRTPLPVATERELVLRAKAGEPGAKAQLVDTFLPLISSVARTYRPGYVERLELLQEGVVGLLRALEGFDPARGTPFWAYASWWVRQAMQQLVADLTRPVALSDRALRHLARMKDAHRESLRERGREPSGAELAERTGLSRRQVDDLLAAERAPRSIDEPVPGEEGAIGTFGDLLVDPLAEDAYGQVLDSIEVQQLHTMLAGLSHRERDVLRARYGLDGRERSLREVGGELGLSGERVRQIERRALAKLASAAAGAEGSRAQADRSG